jgi:hypothetical protein
MWKKILKIEIIFLVVVMVLIFTMPILAREINEHNIKNDEFIKVISALPDNELRVWSGGLPENQEKIKIKKIIINLNEQKLRTYENNEMIDEYLVSTGKKGMETPIGEYKVEGKRQRAWSKMAGLWMPYFMLIEKNKGIGIHELPEWPSGYKEGVDHLGTAVSHGCIRLGVGAAAEVFNWAEVGTLVIIKF